MTIGQNIRRIRKEKGLTQQQLGELLNMTQAAIGQFEKDKTSPKIDTINKIASALGVSATDIIGDLQTSQGERIRIIRKSFGLTLEEFGERLGVKKGAISKLEKNQVNLTEQMAKLICHEYNVNYDYLVNGTGKMFPDTDDDFCFQVANIMLGNDEPRKKLFKLIIDLNNDDIVALERIFDKIIQSQQLTKR